MNSNETRKTKQDNNKTTILEKLMESIMSEEADRRFRRLEDLDIEDRHGKFVKEFGQS